MMAQFGWLSSFLRFLLVGVVNTLIGLGIMFFLYNVLELNYWASTFIGNMVGAMVSYFLNKTFTFRSDVRVQHNWWKFAIVILSCYALSYGASHLFAQALSSALTGVNPKLLQNGAILVGSGIYMISNYIGHKNFTFASK
jgi:putative flippase GtrA